MVKYLALDPAVRNLAYCKMEMNNDNKISNLNFGMFDLTDNKKVKQCTFSQIIDNLIKYLNLIQLDGIDIVLVENQPSKLNMISKSVSICIYTFFKMKNMDVRLISPSRKLKNNKMTYKQRKDESVKLCYERINEMDKLILEQYTKKDDIADCVNMTYAFHTK
jgi:hypothetical protein